MILGSFIFGSSAVLAAPYSVTDGADSNTPGTLRYGLNNGETEISIDTALAPLGSPLTYNGLNALTIHGNGATVSGGDFTLLEITQGADLAISNLDFEGPGGYSVHPAGQGGGKGIFVEVPLEREGVVSLVLTDVTVKDVGDHGVHVSDCDIEGCGAGGGGGGDGSSASVYAWLDGVEIDGVGFG